MFSTTTMNRRDCIFYGEVVKGYIIKTLVDVLVGSFNRTPFSITENGIYIRDCDKNRSILFNIELHREKFIKYKCVRDIFFSANVKHIQRLIRNLKKKDSLILGIRKETPDILCIMICPARKTENTNYRRETADIRIQIETNPSLVDIPNSEVYKFPYVIDASEFQKVKRISSVAKVIKVVIQGDSYLGFICDKEIYSTALHFGDPPSLEKNDEEDSSEEEEEDSETDSHEEDTVTTTSSPIYTAEFNSSLFNHLVKLPGLCTQMQFYAPTEDLFPLRIRMEAGLLGIVDVYIKDTKTLQYDEEIVHENNNL